MFLDKSSKKIIKLMRNTPPNMTDGLFTSDFIARQCNINDKHCTVFLEHLAELQLIKIHTIPYENTISGTAIWGYSLMPKGIAYNEYQRHEFIDLLLKSILLPIVVSILTFLLLR